MLRSRRLLPRFRSSAMRFGFPRPASGSRDSDPVTSRERVGGILAGSVLPFLLIVYLSLEAGGYEAIARSEVGIAVWWLVVVGAVIGVLPAGRIERPGLIGLGLLGAFALWTGLAILWSESAERSITELARVATLLGVFVLALSSQGPDHLRRVIGSVAAAIALVAILALGSRLHPSWFPPNAVADALPTEVARLSYPLTYWNGVATLLAIGVPLLLWTATSARHLGARALSVAALPLLALVVYYTLSRGGVAEAAIGLAVLLALHPRRRILLPPLLIGGAGAVALIIAAGKRSELADGLLTPAALDQGDEMAVITLGVCALAGLLGAAAELGRSREIVRIPSVPISRRSGARAAGAAAVALIAVALVAGLPGELADRWDQFKQPINPGSDSARFSSVSGSGRYQWWESAVEAGASDPLRGIGPGTFEYWWARSDGGIPGFVRDAHSLYLESFGELGILGAALIAALVLGIVGVGVGRSLRRRRERERVEMAAAATAAAATFAAAAAVDWSWELTVLPVVFFLLGAALLGPSARSADSAAARDPEPRGGALRPVLLALSALALVVIAIPMLSDIAVRSSRDLVDQGRLLDALDSARHAEDLDPLAASPNLQEALVLELGGDLTGAATAARQATIDEPTNFRNWLILSRIEAELGNTEASAEAFRMAGSLNPRSYLFN